MNKQSNKDFLSNCNLKENTLEGVLALKVRGLLADYANSYRKIKRANNIFAHYKIVDDLNISHVDSLNLVDIILELENSGILITPDEAQKLFNANEKKKFCC